MFITKKIFIIFAIFIFVINLASLGNISKEDNKQIIRKLKDKTYILSIEKDELLIKIYDKIETIIDLNELPYAPDIKLNKMRKLQDFMILNNGEILIIDNNIGGIIKLNKNYEYEKKMHFNSNLLYLWQIDSTNILILANNIHEQYIIVIDEELNIKKQIKLFSAEYQVKWEKGYFNIDDIYMKFSLEQVEDNLLLFSNTQKKIFYFDLKSYEISNIVDYSDKISSNCRIAYIYNKLLFYFDNNCFEYQDNKFIQFNNPLPYFLNQNDCVEKDQIIQYRNGEINVFNKK